jgi:diguanylate cyclase (GGDEF)-like protein
VKPGTAIAHSESARSELAKSWLLEIIGRTPLEDAGDIQVDWLAREAPQLIGEIADALDDPAREAALPGERASGLARLRGGGQAAARIPEDLGALQSLFVELLRRDVPERTIGDFSRSVQRLAEVFGSVHGAVADALVRERSGVAAHDEVTGLPGTAELYEWLRVLIAEHRRYGHRFALLLIDVDGLSKVNDAHGREEGDRMLSAVARVIREHVRAVDRSFRLADDEFCVLAPHQELEPGRAIADRLANVVEASADSGRARLSISIGLAACPDHGDSVDTLLEAAETASYAAKAAGVHVAVGERR